MLERTVVYVDTSYLLASFYNSWEIGARAQLEIDLPEVVAVLDGMIVKQLGQRVHRQNWYDGIPDTGPHRYQRALRTCEGVQLRTGQLIEWGERRTQKAVDTRLVADMVTSACKQQFTDMVLVSGDADMIPGVQEATNAGIRVHLYGFGWDSMSAALRHVCDTTTILDPREDFAGAMELQVLEGPLPPTVRENQSPEIDAETAEETGSAASSAVAEAQESPESATSAETTEQAPMPSRPSPSVLAGRPQKSGAEPRKPDSDEFAETKDAPLAPDDVVNTPPPTPGNEAASPKITPAAPTTQSETPPGEELDDEPDPSEVEAELRAHSRAATGAHSVDATKVSAPEGASAEGVAAERASAEGAASEGFAAETREKDSPAEPATPKPTPRPSPSMMAPRRKLRSRYVPLPEEVWTSAGFQTPYDVGQQYARWWYDNAASTEQRDKAHLLSGGGLPPEVDRPLLQFACETLHEYTLSETQRVKLRDGFHSGIRGVLLNDAQNQ